ncbi:MAG: hypothetical protein SGPRY_014950, partial [Prymnesium sp.]
MDPAPNNRPADIPTDKHQQASRTPDLDENTSTTASQDPPDPPSTPSNPKARTCDELDPEARKLTAWTSEHQCKLPDGHVGNCEWE